MRYTWHDERDGYGTVLEAEKSGIGTYAEGYSVVHLGMRLEEAQRRYGPENVTVLGPIPVVVEVGS